MLQGTNFTENILEVLTPFVNHFEYVHECCEECGDEATKKITYLYSNYRNNSASAAYGKDDCSWCQDEERFTCEKHCKEVEHNPPVDMVYCSTFTKGDRFLHMFRKRRKNLDSKRIDELLVDAEIVIEKLYEKLGEQRGKN